MKTNASVAASIHPADSRKTKECRNKNSTRWGERTRPSSVARLLRRVDKPARRESRPTNDAHGATRPTDAAHLAFGLRISSFVITLLLSTILHQLSTPLAHSQLVADGTTASINGIATNIAGNLIVGNTGSFTTLNITNAGTVTNTTTGAIGETVTARTNRVIVTGTNSVWHNGGTLGVGRAGQFNELIITNGGLVVNSFGNMSASSGGISNRAVVTGPGSRWVCTSTVNVGNSGPYNVLLITNGGRVDSPGGVVGNASIGNQVTVSGNGSLWNCDNGVFVGQHVNSNHLIITDGGDVLSGGAYVGGNLAQSGSGQGSSVVITGAGSTWTNTSASSVGNSGAFNRLTITNGGAMRNTAANAALVIGWQQSGSNNAVLITGTNSVFANNGTILGIRVGMSGPANELHIRDGALAHCDQSVIGFSPTGSNNVAVIADAGSRWLNTLNLDVGNLGSGSQCWVTNGALAQSGNVTIGAQLASYNNLLQVQGATLIVTNATSTGTFDIRSGTNVFVSGLIEVEQLRLTNSAGVLDLRGGLFSVESSIISNGLPFRVGNGISAATFTVVSNGLHDWSGATSRVISSNATLAGNGTIIGTLVVTNGGVLSPGPSIGKIIFSNSPTLLGTTFVEISKNGATITNDVIQVAGTLTFGGTLTITNLGPTALTNGDKFTLFVAASYAGAFNTITLPTLGANLAWTNKLLVDGSIEVRFVPPRQFGVDVSHFQGETGVSQSSWNQMFTEGKRFAFIKATEGLTVLDGAMANNVDRATAAGLRAGVYHFAHPELRPTTNGAIQEADYLLTYAGNYIGPGYLRPVLDVEFNAGTLSTADLTDWVIAFANEIITHRGIGAAPIIYCNQTFANNEFDSRLAGYDLWLRTITAIDVSTNEPPPGFPDPTGVFNNWSFWQYSDTGNSGGITPLDLNVCHDEFKQLDTFLIPAVTNPVAPVITTQPQDRTVIVSNNASFSVTVSVASSTPLTYQWRLHGTNIPGANASVFTRNNAQFDHAGPHTVVITNAAGSVTSSVATLTVTPPPPPFQGVTLWSENFDGYVAPSVVNTPVATNGFKLFFHAASGGFDFTARFGFNYATVVSPTNIPSAPNSSGGTTKGLSLTVNKDVAAVAAALNLYPLSQTFTGNIAFKADVWINYPNSASATEHALLGINHSANFTNRVSLLTSDGLFLAMDGDGGTTSGSATLRDFALFRGGGAGAIPFLLTNGNTVFGPEPLLGANFDNADAGFGALFPSQTLPSFTTVAGAAGNRWVRFEARQQTNLVTWLLNDTVIAQFTNTSAFTNGNVLIGYNDAFNSIGGADNFAVFDNLRVETSVPDYDGDGLTDLWEVQFFGGLGALPGADSDGDGVSNLNEQFAGTNPTNAVSAFRLLSAAKLSDDLKLNWTTVGGKSYVVQRTTNTTASFTTTFADLSPPITIGGTNEGATNYLHLGGATNAGGYYRIRLVP